MTAENEISARARKMLVAIQASGEWMSRVQVARASGKKRLIPYDVDLLQQMVEKGLIEIRQRASATPIGIAYEYKAK